MIENEIKNFWPSATTVAVRYTIWNKITIKLSGANKYLSIVPQGPSVLSLAGRVPGPNLSSCPNSLERAGERIFRVIYIIDTGLGDRSIMPSHIRLYLFELRQIGLTGQTCIIECRRIPRTHWRAVARSSLSSAESLPLPSYTHARTHTYTRKAAHVWT